MLVHNVLHRASARLGWSSIMFLLCWVTQSAIALNSVDVTNAARPSIVFLTINGVTATGAIQSQTATGILLSSEGHVLTVYHALTDRHQREFDYIESITGVVGGSRFDNPIPLEIVDPEPDIDLALLAFQESIPPASPVLTVCDQQPLGGEILFGFGFPMGKMLSPALVVFAGHAGRYWQASGGITNGMSGGPVYDQQGSLRAVIHGGYSGNQVVRTLIPANYASEWLSRYGVPISCGTYLARVPTVRFEIANVRGPMESFRTYDDVVFVDVLATADNAGDINCKVVLKGSYNDVSVVESLDISLHRKSSITREVKLLVPPGTDHINVAADSYHCKLSNRSPN